MKPVLIVVTAAVAGLALAPRPVLAHCDTLDGPVVKDARAALDAKEVTPVLKWVKADREAEVREAFQRTVSVRGLGTEARGLADRFFFETLVRIHREGEGAPYTGLKPAGAAVDPGIEAADAALESGSVEALVRLVGREVEDGLRRRHARAAEARTRSAQTVEKGRQYVEAYVEFIHYAERLLSTPSDPEHAH